MNLKALEDSEVVVRGSCACANASGLLAAEPVSTGNVSQLRLKVERRKMRRAGQRSDLNPF